MTNKFAGRCARCGASVAAGAGVVGKVDGRWVTYCLADAGGGGADEAPVQSIEQARTIWGWAPSAVAPSQLPPLGNLDEEQFAVATFGPGEAVVAAGAGAGKTATLVQRVLYGLRTGATPARMAVLAFNKRAAAEFQERLLTTVGPAAEGVVVRTFHAWAYAVLRLWYPGAPWLASERILDVGTIPKEPVIAAALRAAGVVRTDPDAATLAGWSRLLGRVANALIDPLDHTKREQDIAAVTALLGNTGDQLDPEEVLTAAAAYQEAKRARGRIDFDDMLVMVARAIRLGTPAGRALGSWYDHIMQDEAQDGNLARWAILDGLYGGVPGKTLVSAGDVRQSINGFAGALPALFEERIARGATLLTMRTNYRSAGAVVDLGNRIAAGRSWNLGGELRPRTDAPPGVIDVWWDAPEQISAVTEDIATQVRANPALAIDGRPRFAILTRTRGALAGFELALQRAGIPARVIGSSVGVWDTPVGRRVLAYVRCHAEARLDAATVQQVANTPVRWVRRDVIERAFASCGGDVDRVLVALMAEGSEGSCTLASDLRALRRASWPAAVEMIRGWVLPPPADETSSAAPDAQAAIDLADTRELATMLLTMIAVAEGPEVVIALANAAASAAAVRKKGDDHEPAVLLSTVHTYKGLEADTVYLPWLLDGTFPNSRAMRTPTGLEEERRLFYVAVTRARRRLVLLPDGDNPPCRFLAEAGLVPPDDDPPRTALPVPPPTTTAPTGSAAPPAVTAGPPATERAWAEPAPPWAVSGDILAAVEREEAEERKRRPTGERTGEGSRFVVVTAEQFRDLLGRLGWSTEAVEHGQLVISSPVRGGVGVRVYTTVRAGGTGADLGEDSIRVAAVYCDPSGTFHGMADRQSYVPRTSGWRGGVLRRIASLADAIAAAPCCPACGAPMRTRDGGARGPFWGCVRFPSCRGTRSVDTGSTSTSVKGIPTPARPPGAGGLARTLEDARTLEVALRGDSANDVASGTAEDDDLDLDGIPF